MPPIAYFHSPFASKFGIPRQSGIVDDLDGEIVFTPEWQNADALRGLEGFDYIWLIWDFSANKHESTSPTVRPPLLGGNKRMGVFATRSPYRPNHMGLSSVRISSIEWDTPRGPIIHVKGADLMDGTPILDIKPYLPFTDSHPNARAGFTDAQKWQTLTVNFPASLQTNFSPKEVAEITHILEQDPRPHYQEEPTKIYGMPYKNFDIKFYVKNGALDVTEICFLNKNQKNPFDG